jgi:Protein of unknown function (DUF3987)
MRALLHLLGAARRLWVRVMTPVERVQSALEAAGSRRSGRDWQCPAHEDRKASLSVSEGRDGRAVLCCHAGCPTEAVLVALGLDWPDLFPEGRNGKAQLVATYDYTDEQGRLLYQAVRYFPKGFKRRRPDGRGGWLWKLGDTRLVLYRLPRVLAAVEAGLPVYVVEGEKDVHAIEQAGATATTVLGGVSGRWLPEFSRLLAKTRVVVVADNDPPGRKRAVVTARAIAAVGGRVEVVRAAVGNDAADHLAAGRALADLLPADQEPERTPAGPGPAEGSAESAESAETTPAWEPPAPLGPASEAAAFPVRALPGWLANYVQAVATATQTPPDLAAMMVLSVLAAAAGGLAEVAVRPDWREPLNLFAAVGLSPGSRKSAVVRDVTRPLLDLERELVTAEASAILEAGTARKVAERAADQAQTAAGKAAADQAQAALADAIAAAQRAAGIQVPAPPRLLVDDATPEALASLLAEQGGRIALLSPEGDVFDMMAGRYAQGGGPNLGVYLKGHAGDPLRVDRKGRPPEHVDRPALTVGLAVQPEVLRQIADRPGFRGRGLLARFLWALPVGTVGRRQVGAAPVPARVRERYETEVKALARSLLDQAEVGQLAGVTEPMTIPLDPAAAAVLLELERELEPRLDPETGDLAHVEGWAAKLAGATARIAGLLHLAEHLRDGWARPVEAETMHAAVAIARYLTDHALAVFDLMGADPALADARYLLDWIQRTGAERFTRRELFTALPRGRFPKVDALDPGMELLEAHGHIRRVDQPAPKGPGRRPSPTYEVNPLRRPRTPRPGISADCADSAAPPSRSGRLPGLDPDDPGRWSR